MVGHARLLVEKIEIGRPLDMKVVGKMAAAKVAENLGRAKVGRWV